MLRRALPAGLILLSLAADLNGRHSLAFTILLGAVPAAFAVALDAYGDALEAKCGGLRPVFASFAVALLVVAATLRSPAVVGGLPQLSLSLAVASLLLYGALAVEALLPLLRVAPARG